MTSWLEERFGLWPRTTPCMTKQHKSECLLIFHLKIKANKTQRLWLANNHLNERKGAHAHTNKINSS